MDAKHILAEIEESTGLWAEYIASFRSPVAGIGFVEDSLRRADRFGIPEDCRTKFVVWHAVKTAEAWHLGRKNVADTIRQSLPC